VLVKLANADTRGAVAIFRHAVAPMSGPPLHRHSREDEWFYVLNGELTLESDGQRIVLRRGGSAFAPRGTVHTYQNFDVQPRRSWFWLLRAASTNSLKTSPCFTKQRSASNPAEIEPIAKKYGIEILGPPLS
jgi:glyoxylate utilization-related uncharacterized protein